MKILNSPSLKQQWTGNLDSVYRLTFNGLEWKEMSPSGVKPLPSDKLASWIYKEKIYIFGGYGPEEHPHELGLRPKGVVQIMEDTYGRGWNNQVSPSHHQKNKF